MTRQHPPERIGTGIGIGSTGLRTQAAEIREKRLPRRNAAGAITVNWSVE